MAKSKTSLIVGRFVKIDFHDLFSHLPEEKRAQAVARACGPTSNAVYRTMGAHFNEVAEVVFHDPEKGYELLFEDGTIGPGSEPLFTVLPAKPTIPPHWEYCSVLWSDDIRWEQTGAEGWELVSVVEAVAGGSCGFFKRLAPKEPVRK